MQIQGYKLTNTDSQLLWYRVSRSNLDDYQPFWTHGVSASLLASRRPTVPVRPIFGFSRKFQIYFIDEKSTSRCPHDSLLIDYYFSIPWITAFTDSPGTSMSWVLCMNLNLKRSKTDIRHSIVYTVHATPYRCFFLEAVTAPSSYLFH